MRRGNTRGEETQTERSQITERVHTSERVHIWSGDIYKGGYKNGTQITQAGITLILQRGDIRGVGTHTREGHRWKCTQAGITLGEDIHGDETHGQRGTYTKRGHRRSRVIQKKGTHTEWEHT